MLVRTGEKNKLALVINNILLQTILSSSQKLIYIAIHGHCTTVSGPAKAVVSPTWWSDALQHQSSVSVATNSCPFTERISDFLSVQWGGWWWCDPTDLENLETTELAKWKTVHWVRLDPSQIFQGNLWGLLEWDFYRPDYLHRRPSSYVTTFNVYEFGRMKIS